LALHELLAAPGARPSPEAATFETSTGPRDSGVTTRSEPAAPEDGRTPPFMLSFDDGTVDHYEVVSPLLEAAGRAAIFFVPTAKLNQPGRLTGGMVKEMAKAGHTIGLHGHEHRRLDQF